MTELPLIPSILNISEYQSTYMILFIFFILFKFFLSPFFPLIVTHKFSDSKPRYINNESSNWKRKISISHTFLFSPFVTPFRIE